MSRLSFTLCAAALLFFATPRAAHAQAGAPSRVTSNGSVERHPRIRAAIRELQAAKVELQKAPHDFGGHRAEAVQAVDRAIEQLRLALQYDKK
jgi:hypothetical protein